MFSQYCRVESKLGGVGSTDRQFIKQVHKMLGKSARRSFAARDARHAFIRRGLEHKRQAEQCYRSIYR
jgi:hypothetical protein